MWERNGFAISTDPAHLDRNVRWKLVTDGATFAWLCDVFVLPAHRGRGLATWLIETVVRHPDLQVQRGFVLARRDAHALYVKLGWQPVEAGRFMRITRPYALAE